MISESAWMLGEQKTEGVWENNASFPSIGKDRVYSSDTNKATQPELKVLLNLPRPWAVRDFVSQAQVPFIVFF